MSKFELGITTFAEIESNPSTGDFVTHDERIRQVLEEIILADKVGLDFFGVGEHHRKDFAVSAPHMILAAAAPLTKQIKLSSAVTVLSSDDPIKVYQNFATIQALSHGRAEIMAGRGSFIESFPLFGYDLQEYDVLFEEKLEILIKARDHEFVDFEGKTRSPIKHRGVYPRNEQPLVISVAVGGTPASIIRAAKYGLPLFLAIIGGEPARFKPLVNLYKKHYFEHGHKEEDLFISVHSHGFITEHQASVDKYYDTYAKVMNRIGKERGWDAYSKAAYQEGIGKHGALYIGHPKVVAEKIRDLKEILGIQRFALHVPVGYMPREDVLKTIEYLGNEVRDYLDQLG